jgi:hypothetical protein
MAVGGDRARDRQTSPGSAGWTRSRRDWSIWRPSSKGCRTPSIAKQSSKTSTSTSCAGAQRPSSWRVTSTATLEGADSNGRFAADRGPASRGSLAPRAPRPVKGEDVRAAPRNHDSASGTRADPPRPASAKPSRCARRAPATDPRAPRERRLMQRDSTSHRLVRASGGRRGLRGASARHPVSTRLRDAREPRRADGSTFTLHAATDADAIRSAGLAAGTLAELLTDNAADVDLSGVALVVRAQDSHETSA